MSFIEKTNGRGFEPGWFLANNEDCTRETMEMKQTDAVTVDGEKIVKGGTVYSVTTGEGNEAVTDYIGIVYEDINVTSGNMPGSVVTKGEVYEDRLAEELTSAVKTALEAKGFKFKTSPAVTRPTYE